MKIYMPKLQTPIGGLEYKLCQAQIEALRERVNLYQHQQKRILAVFWKVGDQAKRDRLHGHLNILKVKMDLLDAVEIGMHEAFMRDA